MTYAYRWPANRKAQVRKTTYYGQPCWAAGRPKGVYFSTEGWHFDDFADALAYATGAAR